jgi:hypothetical protein
MRAALGRRLDVLSSSDTDKWLKSRFQRLSLRYLGEWESEIGVRVEEFELLTRRTAEGMIGIAETAGAAFLQARARAQLRSLLLPFVLRTIVWHISPQIFHSLLMILSSYRSRASIILTILA